MASIHQDRSYEKARRMGAISAHSYGTWNALVSMSKRELAEIAMRLGGLCTDECDNVELALARVLEERGALKANGII